MEGEIFESVTISLKISITLRTLHKQVKNIYKYSNINEEGRIPKEVLNGKFHNTRPVGRPRIRWEEVVQKDALQILGTRGWRRRAENREVWRKLLREAKARKGL
jgi:hypothetical protein